MPIKRPPFALNGNRGDQLFQHDAFLQPGLDFLSISRHASARAAIEDSDALNSRLADRHTRGVHGRIAAADDPDAAVRHRFAFEIVGFQEFDARENSGNIFARKIQLFAGMGSRSDKDSLESILRKVCRCVKSWPNACP